MSLQEALQKFKDKVVAQLDPEDLAKMDAATEELVRSGIAKGVKKEGDRAPDFTLPNPNGDQVSLSRLLARGPVVVTFYRGTW